MSGAAITREMNERLRGYVAPKPTKRPKLTAEDVVEYLDWVLANIGALKPSDVETHMRAAELAIRTRATDAQAKATQHTLVEQGVIEPPPQAS
jgi:hypothetical protein